MDTDNGAIDFEARLTLETLKRQIEEAKRQISGLSDSAVNDTKKMDSGFSSVEKRIAQVASVAALAGLGREIANVRGEFQKYEAILTNTFGSNDKAVESMNMLTDIAAKTPFQLDAITDSYIKLVNQGFTPTRSEIIKMGDLASSTGKGFDQLVEAVLDAQNGEFERLKEFGIKASVNGDKVKMTFKGQTTEIDKSAAAMRNYILSLGGMKGVAGSMEAISGTIVGQISNLEDAFTQMFNNIGEENEGLISGIISGASFAVQHYQEIIDILLPIVATYGAYKAAVIAFAAAQKIAAAATFAKEYLVMAKNLGFATANQIALNGAVLANPYALAIAAVAGLSIAIYEIASSMTEAEKAQQRLTDAMSGADQKISDEKGEIKALTNAINDEGASREYRNKKLKELIAISPEHLNNLTLENIKTTEGTAAIDGYIQAMERRIKMETLDSELKESIKRKQDAERGKENVSFIDKVKAGVVSTTGGLAAGSLSLAGSNVENNLAVVEAEAKLQAKINAEKAKLFEEIDKDKGKLPETVINGKYWEAQAKEAQEAIMLLDTKSATYATDRAKQLGIIARAEEELKKIKSPKDTSVTKAKEAKKTDLDLLKEEIEAKKFAYGEDLASYSDYLSQKSDIVSKKGDKDQIKAVKEAQKDNDRDIAKNLDGLVKKYADYEGQKNEVMKRYEDDRYTLMSAGKTKEVAELDKKEKEELKTLEANHVKENASYQYLFDNIDKLSVSALQKRIERLKQDLKLSAATAEEKLAIEKALSEASTALVSRAPMLALKVLNDKARDIKNKISTASTPKEKNDLQVQLDDNTAKKGEALASVFGNVSSRLSEAKQLAGSFGSELGKAVEMTSNLASGFAQIASKNYIGGAITLATTVVSMLGDISGTSMAEREAAATKRLTDAISDTNAQLERQVRLTEMLQGLQKSGGYADAIDQTAAALAKTTELLGNELDAYSSKLNDSTKMFWNQFNKEKFTTIGFEDEEGWKSLLDTIGKGMDKFTNSDWQTVINSAAGEQKVRLEELYNEWITLQEKQQEYFNTWAEGLTGTSLQSMVDGMASAFDDGIYSAEEFAKNFEDLMKTAVLNALKTNVIDEPMKQWNKHFAEAMSDGALTKEEADALRKEMQDIKDKAAAGLDAINQAGLDFGTDATKASLSGSISASVTEETATLLSGYINAIRINQINSIAVMNNMLSQLNVIAGNTSYNKYLESIDKSLTKLSGDSTRAFGI